MTYTLVTPFNIILIGDQSVGKTSILNRFIENTFTAERERTENLWFKDCTININGRTIQANIWDCPGDQPNRIENTFLSGRSGVLLVYSVTDKKSFDNIIRWINKIDPLMKDSVKILVGNKCDDTDGRQVSFESGQQLAHKHGFKFMETSAKSNANIEQVIHTLCGDIITKYENKLLFLLVMNESKK